MNIEHRTSNAEHRTHPAIGDIWRLAPGALPRAGMGCAVGAEAGAIGNPGNHQVGARCRVQTAVHANPSSSARFPEILKFPNKSPISSLVSSFLHLYTKNMKRLLFSSAPGLTPLRHIATAGEFGESPNEGITEFGIEKVSLFPHSPTNKSKAKLWP